MKNSNEYMASKILRENQVDSSFDARTYEEILFALVQDGHLPGRLLKDLIQNEQVITENNNTKV